jgi:hypothetical protein
MITRRTLAMTTAILLAPALAAAQDATPPAPAAPAAPQAPQAPQTPQTPQTPQSPGTNTSSNQPVVVVNPNQTAPTTAPAPTPVTTVPAIAPTTVVNDNHDTGDEVDYWNAPVFATGALTFGGTYLASVIVAGSSDHQGNNHLYVPVAGPWLDLADRGPNCPALQNNCDSETTAKILLVADGVFQAAGIITMLDGVLAPTHHTRVVTTAQRDYHIVPTTVHGNAGLAVFGHF